MKTKPSKFLESAQGYVSSLSSSFTLEILLAVEEFCMDLAIAWREDKKVFICGNGGSAANALHMANDLEYGTGNCGPGPRIPGLKVEALPSNPGLITCLANDTGYENIFAYQIKVKANPGDHLIVLSGSGNSENTIKALIEARSMKMKSCAIVAFDGGKCKALADHAIHIPIEDMQIAEDTQLIISHICMQWLNRHKPTP